MRHLWKQAIEWHSLDNLEQSGLVSALKFSLYAFAPFILEWRMILLPCLWCFLLRRILGLGQIRLDIVPLHWETVLWRLDLQFCRFSNVEIGGFDCRWLDLKQQKTTRRSAAIRFLAWTFSLERSVVCSLHLGCRLLSLLWTLCEERMTARKISRATKTSAQGSENFNRDKASSLSGLDVVSDEVSHTSLRNLA